MPRQRKASIFAHRVGLDIGSHTVKGVEVIERSSDIVVCSAGAVAVPGIKGKQDLPDHSSLVQAIKSLWSSARFTSRKVVLALPSDAVNIKWLHLEASSLEELDTTARSAAIRGAPFPADDAIVDYRVLPAHGAKSANIHFVMLVAASATAVDMLLNATENAGLEPLAVDIGAVAVLRSVEAQKKAASPMWSGQPLAHIIVGARNTTITVIRGGEPEFIRTIPVGGNDFTECIAEHCEVSWGKAEMIKATPGTRLVESGTMITSHDNEELRIPCENIVGRLSREIQRSLRFFTSQFAEGSYLGMISTATMSGGGALLKGLDTCLQADGIEVMGTVNPFAGLSVDAQFGMQSVSNAAVQYATAVGLTLGGYWSMPVTEAETEVAA